MSKFSKEEQTEIVRWAMNLESAIKSETVELKRLKNERFKLPPAAPVRKLVNTTVKINPEYPAPPTYNDTFQQFLDEEVKTDQSILSKIYSNHPFKRELIILAVSSFLMIIFCAIAPPLAFIAFLLGFSFPVSIYYYIIKQRDYNKKRDDMNEALKKSPQYLQARAEAERIAKEKEAAIISEQKAEQEQFDLEYAKQKENYDNVIMPKYNDELALWNAQQQIKIQVISEDLNSNRETLAELYESTMLISKNNRTLAKLTWLYEDMSTSEHDIERATDLLNSQNLEDGVNKVTNSINYMHSGMNKGFSAVYASIQKSNYIMQENNYIMQDGLYDISNQLAKTRRNLNAGLVAAGIQNHNTNRQLKTVNKQFEELRKKFG